MAKSPITVEEIFARIKNCKRSGDSGRQWMASCPCAGHANGDSSQSLAISLTDDGKILMNCFVGHGYNDVLQAIGLTPADAPKTSRPHKREPRRPGRASKPRKTAATDAAKSLREQLDAGRRLAETGQHIDRLADQLGVAPDALRAIEVGFASKAIEPATCGIAIVPEHWLIPEKDTKGGILSLQRRFEDGTKRTPEGQRRGLVYPASGLQSAHNLILCVEGASDTAAALTLGFAAVGRPSNATGGEEVAELAAPAVWQEGHDLVILGENDQSAAGWPGRDGAERVARDAASRLGHQVLLCMPPAFHKDLRAWLQSDRPSAEAVAAYIRESSETVWPEGFSSEATEKVGNVPNNRKCSCHAHAIYDPNEIDTLNNTQPGFAGAQPGFAGAQPAAPAQPKPTFNRCHYGVLLRHREQRNRERATFLSCWCWGCLSCIKMLKKKWCDHFTNVLSAISGPLYVFKLAASAWKSCYNCIVKKSGLYAKIDTHGKSEVLVISTVPFKKSPPITSQMALSQVLEVITNLPLCKRPISTCRQWKLEETQDAAGVWEKVGTLDNAPPATVQAEVEARGMKVVVSTPRVEGKIVKVLDWCFPPGTPDEEISRFNFGLMMDVFGSRMGTPSRREEREAAMREAG